MKITHAWLVAMGACKYQREWFRRTFGRTQITYQEMLDTLIHQGETEFVHWLIKAIDTYEFERFYRLSDKSIDRTSAKTVWDAKKNILDDMYLDKAKELLKENRNSQ